MPSLSLRPGLRAYGLSRATRVFAEPHPYRIHEHDCRCHICKQARELAAPAIEAFREALERSP